MNVENKKQFITMLLAVGLGLMAAFLTSQYVKTSNSAAMRDLAEQYSGQKGQLENELVQMKQHVENLAKNQESLAKQLREKPTIVPTQQIVTAVDKKGDVLDDTVFSLVTPPGKRALTVEIESLAAVGGLVNPGDYVDVIAHLKIPDGPDAEKKPNDVTSVLFQDIQVLAVGTNFKPVGNALTYAAQQKSNKIKVTLALTPEEAALLSFADENGNLQLSLRAPTEQGKKMLQVASWDALSDYVKDHQGTELIVPKSKKKVKESGDNVTFEVEDDNKPFVQIFRGGKEL